MATWSLTYLLYIRLRQDTESRVALFDRTNEEKNELTSDVEHLKQRVYELEGIYKSSEEEKETLQREVLELNRLLTQQQTDSEGIWNSVFKVSIQKAYL